MPEQAVYEHDIGDGQFLSAFSLDPGIDKEGLVKIVTSMDGKASQDAAALSETITRTDYADSLSGLTLEVDENDYHVPAILAAYREAIGRKWDNEGKFNGPVLIATGEIKFPLKVAQGGYYDFAATRLAEVPAKLLPCAYQQGKTVEDILNEEGIDINQRARYFGLAHLIWPSNGEEFLLVQRAKGMGIAADCISSPGSTPDIVLKKPGLKKPGFGVKEYWSYHFAEEMADEYKLKWGDFWVEDTHLFDDKKSIPFGAVNITTNLSVREISQKAYGDARVLKEHNILYKVNPEAFSVFLKKFPVFPAIAHVISLKEKGEL